jgi:hypothetical protein
LKVCNRDNELPYAVFSGDEERGLNRYGAGVVTPNVGGGSRPGVVGPSTGKEGVLVVVRNRI